MRKRQAFLRLSGLLLISICIAICSALMVPMAVVQAHAFVTGSDPVDGSTITTVPTAVRIFFNAPVSSLSSVHIYFIKNGQLIDISAAATRVSTSDIRELTTPIETPTTQPQGSYEVLWTAVADDDGHTTYGIIGFNVGFSSTGASAGTAILGPSSSNNLTDVRSLNDYTSLLLILWDWFTLATLILWSGILIVEMLLQQESGRSAEILQGSMKSSRSLQWFCLSSILCGEIILPILRAIRLSEALKQGSFSFPLWQKLLFSTSYGHVWLIRIVLILCVLGLLYRSKPGAERNTHLAWTNLLLALLIMGSYALTGDAAQLLTPHLSAIIFDWLFLLAQSIWFGGFFYLGFLLLPLILNPGQSYQSETLIALLKRLTPMVLGGITLLLISMLFLDETSISDLQELISDAYGRTVLVQDSILLVMLLLSLYALGILKSKLTQQAFLLPVEDVELPARSTRQQTLEHTTHNLRRVSKLLAFAGASALFCTALLSFYAPPIVFPDIAYNTSTDQTTASSRTQQIGALSVALQVLPGKSSVANTIIMVINDSHGQPVTDAQVTLTTNMQIMNMGIGHATINPGNALYSATFPKQQAFSMPGLWIISVAIQRPDQSPVQGNFQVLITE